MNKICKIGFIVMLMAVLGAVGSGAHATAKFKPESLTYRVMYKWGMVNKQAGEATLTLRNSGPNSIMQLTAKSQPWADKFYKVRDTLNGSMDAVTLTPVYYEKIAHEGSEYGHDVVRFSKDGAKTIGNCTRVKYKDSKLTKNEKRTLEAYGTTVDMLSSFYYMRTLPYESMAHGHPVTINIFSGKQKELLTLKYMGKETISLGKRKIECYHISFIFTGEGGKKTSDNMDAWISTDDRHVPIKLEGKLKVGKVQCFLVE